MFRKVVLLAVLSAFALSACAGAPAAAPEDPTLKIAVLPILDALPMYAAEAQGYYAAAGIKVEFVPVASAAERDQVMQAGDLQRGIFGSGGRRACTRTQREGRQNNE